jgi:hypothetical protein
MARGSPGPEPELKKTTVLLPAALWRRLRIRAAEESTSASQLLIRALEQYLSEKRR